MIRERETINPLEEETKVKTTEATKMLEKNWSKLSETNRAAAILALAKFEGGNYPITQEAIEKLY